MEETNVVQETATEIVATDGKESVDVQITQTTQIETEQNTTNDKTNSTSQDGREVSPQGRYVKLEERLGTGAYKEVWRAYDTNDGIEVAWNVVKLSRIPPTERKRIKTEVKLLKDIQHKNVIRYFNSWVNRDKEQIIFVTEIMSSGSLKDYLRKNTMVRWMAIKRWCIQILTGLAFLHENHIIHRDIKCDNIFINGATGDIRIGDLGLSTRITEARLPFNSTTGAGAEITASTMTCLGTPEFMAPEMYEESYDERVDIYAFGMCMLEMVTGLLPYHHCASAVQIYRKVLNGELPPELELIEQSNLRAHSFVNACLLPKESRPTAAELLEHAFLQSREDEDLCEVRPKALRYLPIEEEDGDGDDEETEESEGEKRSDVSSSRGSNRVSNVEPTSTKQQQQYEGGEGENPESEATTVVASVNGGSGQNSPLELTNKVAVEESASGKSSATTPKNNGISDDIKIDADMIRALSRTRSTSNPPSATTTRVRRTVLPQGDSFCQGSPRGGLDKRRSSSAGSSDVVLPQTSPGYAMRSNWDRIVTPPAVNHTTTTDDICNPIATTTTRVEECEHDEGHSHCHILTESSIPPDDQAGSITVFDIQDHESLENTLVFYLRIRQHTTDTSTTTGGNCSSPTSNNNSNSNHLSNNNNTDTTTPPINMDKQLEIEFEFDLVNDTIENITEEMLQLEDLQDRLDVSNTALIEVLQPLIIYAKHALIKIQKHSTISTSNNNNSNTNTGSTDSTGNSSSNSNDQSSTLSLAVETVRLLLEAAEGKSTHPAYRTLHRKTSSFTALMCTTNGCSHPDHSNGINDHSNGSNEESNDSHNAIEQQYKEKEETSLQNITSANLPDWLMRSDEYQILYKEHIEYIERIQKDYQIRKNNLTNQSEKLQETQEKDRQALMKRRGDLMTQLDDMQLKFHDRMEEFNMRKNRVLELHLDTLQQQQQGQDLGDELVTSENNSVVGIENSENCHTTIESTGTTNGSYSRIESNSSICSTIHSHIPSEIAGLLN